MPIKIRIFYCVFTILLYALSIATIVDEINSIHDNRMCFVNVYRALRHGGSWTRRRRLLIEAKRSNASSFYLASGEPDNPAAAHCRLSSIDQSFMRLEEKNARDR